MMSTSCAPSRELRRAGVELMRLGQDMLRRAAALDAAQGAADLTAADGAALVLAKQAYDDRRARTEFFSADIFGEPAWDILLDVFVQQQIGNRASVTAAGLGSGSPPSTALRTIRLLEEDGLLIRETDPHDRRRSWLTLSPHAVEAMREYFKTATALGRQQRSAQSSQCAAV